MSVVLEKRSNAITIQRNSVVLQLPKRSNSLNITSDDNSVSVEKNEGNFQFSSNNPNTITVSVVDSDKDVSITPGNNSVDIKESNQDLTISHKTTNPTFERSDNNIKISLGSVIKVGPSDNAELTVDIGEIRETIGIVDGDTDLSSHLTNVGDFYPFSDLPDSTPSVVEALNTLNQQIGDRQWTSVIGLVDGETLTSAIQRIASLLQPTGPGQFLHSADGLSIGWGHIVVNDVDRVLVNDAGLVMVSGV